MGGVAALAVTPRKIAAPVAPPRPTAPPGLLPAVPAPPRRPSVPSIAAAAAAPPGPPRTLRGGPSPTGSEAKVVAIPTQPQFPAVRSPAAPPMGLPGEAELDFDDDEAPTSVLDDKLASIVRTLAGAQAAKPSSGPPPLPIAPGDVGLQAGAATGAAGDVYEIEPVRRAKGRMVAEPVVERRKSPWLLIVFLLVLLAGAGLAVYWFAFRGKGATPPAADAATVIASLNDGSGDAGTAPVPPERLDAGAPTTADAAPAPIDAADTTDVAAEAAPDASADAAPSEAGAEEAAQAADGPAEDAGAVPSPEDAAAPQDVPAVAQPDDAATAPPPQDAGHEPRDWGGHRDSGGTQARDEGSTRRDTGPVTPPSGDIGKLSVISNPWSWVAIDGRSTGRKTPLVNYEVSAGIHRVCLTTEDNREHCTAVRIVAGQPARVVHNF